MDERPGRLGHLRLGDRVHPCEPLVLAEERRVPVPREAGAETLHRRRGLDQERAAECHRAADQPALLDDQDVVELAPEHRLEREHLFPARGLLGRAARPEGHGGFLTLSLSRRLARLRPRRPS